VTRSTVDTAPPARGGSRGPSAEASAAWQEVEENWKALGEAADENWEEAKETFQQSWDDFQAKWKEMTSDQS